MRIQELERRTGLERPSIGFYEKEGLLIPVGLENGYREYSEAEVELLKKIKLLRQLGMSVEKIRALQQGSAFQEGSGLCAAADSDPRN
jgi:DNA-binding transcriptional MerR regulator